MRLPVLRVSSLVGFSTPGTITTVKIKNVCIRS